MLSRSLITCIRKDLKRKMVFISGPRQTGKTTFSKLIMKDYLYFNYDVDSDRRVIRQLAWPRNQKLIIFDELHKMKLWKSWLKGIYDSEQTSQPILITGSAKLDTYRKVGDSLAGRFFSYRLHPFDLKELKKIDPNYERNESFNKLLQLSGFPEPFLEGDLIEYRRWKKSHTDIILRQDIIDLENIREIKSIEILIDIIHERVGSQTSFSSLGRDLNVNHKTVKRWCEILEDLYVIHKVTPYHKNIARSILKEPKFYLFDYAAVKEEKEGGAKIENFVAMILLKEIHLIEDTLGIKCNLHYLKTRDGHELDFLVTFDKKPKLLIEVKSAFKSLSKSFLYFANLFPDVPKLVLVKNLDQNQDYPKLQTKIRSIINWSESINLSSC